MFSHVMVGSNDIERSKRFYDAVLGKLGVGEPIRNMASTGHARLFYRHEGGTFCVSQPIDGGAATCANGGTIGFKCNSPEQALVSITPRAGFPGHWRQMPQPAICPWQRRTRSTPSPLATSIFAKAIRWVLFAATRLVS